MKKTLIVLLVSIFSGNLYATETVKAVQNDQNCVKKDKKGNCPPPPKSAKPTPKKKSEAK